SGPSETKLWTQIEGRTFLLEQVSYAAIEPLLAKLPKMAAVKPDQKQEAQLAAIKQRTLRPWKELALTLPSKPKAKPAAKPNPVQRAEASVAPSRGVGLNYL